MAHMQPDTHEGDHQRLRTSYPQKGNNGMQEYIILLKSQLERRNKNLGEATTEQNSPFEWCIMLY